MVCDTYEHHLTNQFVLLMVVSRIRATSYSGLVCLDPGLLRRRGFTAGSGGGTKQALFLKKFLFQSLIRLNHSSCPLATGVQPLYQVAGQG